MEFGEVKIRRRVMYWYLIHLDLILTLVSELISRDMYPPKSQDRELKKITWVALSSAFEAPGINPVSSSVSARFSQTQPVHIHDVHAVHAIPAH